MNNPLITKQCPQAAMPFLRFQIGRMESRASRIPLYGRSGGRKVLSHGPGPEQNYFRLLGWGETESAAKAMCVESLQLGSIALLETLLNPARTL